VRIHRYLKEEMIDLDFDPERVPIDEWASDVETDEEPDAEPTKRQLWEKKVRVLQSMVALLEKSGKIVNPSKCLTDLTHREKKATTGLGSGIALPHVRTLQARQFVMAVARAPEPGLWFDSVDEEPVRLVFCMVAPNHDDRFYLKMERALAQGFADPEGELKERFLSVETPGEVVMLLSELVD
jgi:mannitol/fructose-specific phosphotransferase system IIA component (Ntr-type)